MVRDISLNQNWIKELVPKEIVVLRRWGILSDEGLRLETTAFTFLTVTNLPYELN